MAEMKFRVGDDLLEALRVAAKTKGVSEAELCRRYLRQQLGLESAYSTVTVLQEVLRGLLREELAPVRRLAFIAAFEAAESAEAVLNALGHILNAMPGAPTDAPTDKAARIRKTVRQTQDHARSVAARRTRDPHPEREAEDPDSEDMDLPQAGEPIELAPTDVALFSDVL